MANQREPSAFVVKDAHLNTSSTTNLQYTVTKTEVRAAQFGPAPIHAAAAS